MKRIFLLAAAALCFRPMILGSAEQARVRVYCLSLQFGTGTGGQAGLDDLNLTTLSFGLNGELAPLFGAYTHWSWFELFSFLYDDVLPGTLNLNTPAFSDLNNDGFDDFFDVSQGVAATSSGIWAFDGGAVMTLTANWNRGAGSPAGTCTLNLNGYGTFVHGFTLWEYTGPFSYTPGATVVTGAVDLVQSGNPFSTLQGPLGFMKVATNRFNQLTLQPGVWTNAYLQTYAFHNYIDYLLRDQSRRTNYYGYLDMDDGEPNSAESDYASWYLSIDDVNDLDQDTIPDFSDDPASAPRRPTLALKRGATDLQLTIAGDVGHTHQVQEVDSLSNTNWQTVLSVPLTNDPQTVSLPLPSSAPKFWRVQAQ